MKHTQKIKQISTDFLIQAINSRKILGEKVRVNLYLPKVVVMLMDDLSDNRGELLTNLVVKEVKAKQATPFGMMNSKTPEKDLLKLKSSWERSHDELAK